MTDEQARDERGKFVAMSCPDPHCCGQLAYEPLRVGDRWRRQYWRCDGLTYSTRNGMLFACWRDVQGPLIEVAR